MIPAILLAAFAVLVAAAACRHFAGPDRRPKLHDIRATVRNSKLHHWLIAGLFLWVIIFAIPGGKDEAARAMLRQQFRLSPEVEMVNFARSKDYGAMTEGHARFTQAQFETYLGQLHDPAVWVPRPLRWNGKLIRDGLEPDLQRWRELPGPLNAGQVPKHLLDMPRIHDLLRGNTTRRGKILCFVIVDETRPASPDQVSDDAARYRTRSCAATTLRDSTAGYVFAVLDLDTRILQMKVRDARFLEG